MFFLFTKALFRLKTLALLFLVLTAFTFTLPAQALEFYPNNDKSGDTINISATRDNVYAAGQTVNANEPVSRDIVAAGQTINIKNSVGRSLILAGQEVNIDVNRVGGATRIAGQKVTISGIFNEELIISANEVEFRSTQVLGDLAISANKITVGGLQVAGDAYVTSRNIDGNIKSRVRGDYKEGRWENREQNGNFFWWWFIAIQISVILFLLLVGYLLKKSKALEIKEITFSKLFGMDLLFGLIAIILPIPLIFISLILQIYPLALLLSGLIYLLFILSSFYFSIYLANLINNVFKLKINFILLVTLTYLGIVLLTLIPVIGNLLGFLLFLVQLANFGFLSRKLSQTLGKSFQSESTKEVKEVPQIKTESEETKSEEDKKRVSKSSKSDKKGLETIEK